ncbi:hypothetical protein ENH_00071830 [Eimeria necatrix]|uniref:Uncharacterized protein n=1 Tax=Eimeria necatrix TaxID=51315 RepID=U6MJX8_9EIME|nr:hypothetical protein ENH_00071830 [Eimeria necatrix]CDJ64326.1 hypothetical protein ENH_00071830 [Eimeria necatrix]
MVVMRMQNMSKELRELWDADAPQSMNADVQESTENLSQEGNVSREGPEWKSTWRLSASPDWFEWEVLENQERLPWRLFFILRCCQGSRGQRTATTGGFGSIPYQHAAKCSLLLEVESGVIRYIEDFAESFPGHGDSSSSSAVVKAVEAKGQLQPEALGRFLINTQQSAPCYSSVNLSATDKPASGKAWMQCEPCNGALRFLASAAAWRTSDVIRAFALVFAWALYLLGGGRRNMVASSADIPATCLVKMSYACSAGVLKGATM